MFQSGQPEYPGHDPEQHFQLRADYVDRQSSAGRAAGREIHLLNTSGRGSSSRSSAFSSNGAQRGRIESRKPAKSRQHLSVRKIRVPAAGIRQNEYARAPSNRSRWKAAENSR